MLVLYSVSCYICRSNEHELKVSDEWSSHNVIRVGSSLTMFELSHMF